jgi:hypothetical protein
VAVRRVAEDLGRSNDCDEFHCPYMQQEIATTLGTLMTFIRSIIIAQEREARINGEITVKEVRLISSTGEQLGVVSVRAKPCPWPKSKMWIWWRFPPPPSRLCAS